MSSYRIIRTHKETYVIDNVQADSPEEAVKLAMKLNEDDFDFIESSAYDYKAIKEDKLI